MFEDEIFIKCCFDSAFSVSNLGRLRNDETKKILKPRNIEDNEKYKYFRFKDKIYYAHKVIYKSFNPEEDLTNKEIDHINKIKGDNRLINLRSATDHENKLNQVVRKNNKLGEKNISKAKNRQGKDYFIFIIRSQIIKHRKTFKTFEEAKEYKLKFYNDNKNNYPFLCI
jgi:hypothetical protein